VLELRPVPEEARSGWVPVLAERLDLLRFSYQYDDPQESRAKAREFVEGVLETTRIFEVVDGDDTVGHLWWGTEGENASVMDVRLDAPERVAELVPALLDLARAAGRARIGIGGAPQDPSRTALVELPGFTARATNMLLRLDAPPADPGGLELRGMSEERFEEFFATLVRDYADELHAAGMSREAADEQSRTQSAQLIPDGVGSPGQEFFTAWVGTEPVGHLWLSTERPMAFVYDVAVREDQRRKGYGAAIMNAGARWAREHGHPSLGLNVFAHNTGARALYDSLGYVVTVDFRTLDVPDAG
jgi:GNAT superfamily N-acetyltransferase